MLISCCISTSAIMRKGMGLWLEVFCLTGFSRS